MSTGLKIFGHFVSQPSRAVLWLLKSRSVVFDFETVDVMSGAHKTDEYRRVNPAQTIPAMVDSDANVTLFESAAILTYLAEKYEWDDLWPRNDSKRRHLISQVLHWHHLNSRMIAANLFRPVMLDALIGKEFDDKARERGERTVAKVAKMVEQWVGDGKEAYLVGDQLSLADYQVYCEFDQLLALDLFDFSPYPGVTRWFDNMRRVPAHDEVRRTLGKFAQLVRDKQQAKL